RDNADLTAEFPNHREIPVLSRQGGPFSCNRRAEQTPASLLLADAPSPFAAGLSLYWAGAEEVCARSPRAHLAARETFRLSASGTTKGEQGMHPRAETWFRLWMR